VGAVLGVAVLGVVLGGCAAKPGTGRPEEVAKTPGGPVTPAVSVKPFEVLGPAGAALGPIRPERISLEVPAATEHRPWDPAAGERLLTVRRERLGQPGRRVWRATVAEGAIAPDLGKLSQRELVVEADGSVALARTDEAAERVFTLFEPAMVVLPAGLVPGARREQTLRMTVYPAGNPGTPQSTGEARHTVEYMGDVRVRTPAGEFDARHLRTSLRVTLGPAEVSVDDDLWYADGVGLLAEDSRELVKAVGLVIRRKRERWSLVRADALAATGLEQAVGRDQPGRE
jgi:hypothetical protein